MSRGRMAALALGGSCLLAGAAFGPALARRPEPDARAAPRSAMLESALPSPDFIAIARKATPAVVNISALQAYRTHA